MITHARLNQWSLKQQRVTGNFVILPLRFLKTLFKVFLETEEEPRQVGPSRNSASAWNSSMLEAEKLNMQEDSQSSDSMN